MHRIPNLRRRRLAARLAVALALAAALGAARLAPAAAADEPSVRIENFRFEPAELVVAPGTRVTWVNADEELHAVIGADGAFASAGLDTGESYTREFDAPGTYEYGCSLHPQMKGRIVVR